MNARLDTVLAELRALRAEVATLTAVINSTRFAGRAGGPRSKPLLSPTSVSPGTAAQMLDLHHDTVRELVVRGVFTILAPNGRGVGKRIYLLADEVTKYGETRDEQAVRQLRQERGRLGDIRPARASKKQRQQWRLQKVTPPNADLDNLLLVLAEASR